MEANYVVFTEQDEVHVKKPLASCLVKDLDYIMVFGGEDYMFTMAVTEKEALERYHKLKSADGSKPCKNCSKKARSICHYVCKEYKTWKEQALGWKGGWL